MNTDTEKTTAAAPEAAAPEQDELGMLFRRAARLMLRGHHPHGPVHPAQGRVLALLRERGPASQRLLMENMGVRSGSLSELLAKLERQGLIERTRDEEDKRGFIIALTAHGDALVVEHTLREKAVSDILFAPLAEEEREQLRLLLQKLIEAWKEEREEKIGCPRHPHPRERLCHGGHHRMRAERGCHDEQECPDMPGRRGHRFHQGRKGGQAGPEGL